MRRNGKSKLSAKKLIIGSGIAAGAGYLAGILTAPKSGKETREDIVEAAEKGRRDAGKELKKLSAELNDLIDQAKTKGAEAGRKGKEEAKIALEKAQDTKEKVREVLSAFHEGDAEDEDLRRAVKNASSSIKSLKKYLKK